MKTSYFGRVVVTCTILLGCAAAFAADAGPKDPLKESGLTKGTGAYVLADEAAVLDGMKALRATKAEADKEVRARKAIDLQIATKQKVMKDAEKTYKELEAKLPAINKPDVKNNIIIRMNRMVADHKSATVALKELDEQANKLSISGQTKYVDELVKLSGKAAGVSEKYAALASNADVKAALAKANLTAVPKVPLGPSPEFAAVTEELKKWQAAVESEAIPMREDHGTFTVEVLVNGERLQMGVDTGASSVCLPAEVAEKLKIELDEKSEVVHMKLADGRLIDGRETTLATVRVGRFTAENVSCVVLQKGLPDPAILLGGSFLNRYVVKLDPGKNELHLTEIAQPGAAGAAAKPTAPASSGATGTPGK